MNDRPTAPEPAHREGASDLPAATAGRPYWLTEPCPDWCDEDQHSAGDDDEDRTHFGSERRVPMHLARSVTRGDAVDGPFESEYASLYLRQHIEHRDPTIWLGKGELGEGFTLRLEEGEAIGQQLLVLVQEALR